MPTFSLAELAALTGATIQGDPDWRVEQIRVPEEAGPKDLIFLLDRRWKQAIVLSQARAVLLPKTLAQILPPEKSGLLVDDPRAALATLLQLFHRPVQPSAGIHPSVLLGQDCQIDPSAWIGPYCVLGDRVRIGPGSVLKAHVYVGSDSRIGSDCLLYPQITLYDRVQLGHRVIVHSGTVIGADGYGFYLQDGRHHKIPQTGGVEIGDDVEIGALVTIDRGTVGHTRIGAGSKIDNQVQIGHNVRVGQHCLIVAQTGIAGSTVLEDYVTLAGQTGVAGHLHIGRGVTAAGKSGITHDLPAGMKVSGFPAQEHRQELKQQALLRQLPELLKDLKKK